MVSLRRSPLEMKPATARGMTLIEVLVVVVIASVVATLVTLRLGAFNLNPSPRDQLSEVAQAVDAVCEQALFRGKPQTLLFYDQGLIWNDTKTSELVTWSAGSQPRLVIEGHATPIPNTPESSMIRSGADLGSVGLPPSDSIRFHILCDPLGQRTAFELQLGDGDRLATLLMASDGQWQIESGVGR